MAPIANIVVKGIAPEECLPHIKKLMKTPSVNMMPGYKVAVWGRINRSFITKKRYISAKYRCEQKFLILGKVRPGQSLKFQSLKA